MLYEQLGGFGGSRELGEGNEVNSLGKALSTIVRMTVWPLEDRLQNQGQCETRADLGLGGDVAGQQGVGGSTHSAGLDITIAPPPRAPRVGHYDRTPAPPSDISFGVPVPRNEPPEPQPLCVPGPPPLQIKHCR